MIIVSSRHSLRDSDAFGEKDEFYDATFSLGGMASLIKKDPKEAQDTLKNKKIFLLVHGCNNDFDDVCRAYNIIEKNLQMISSEYDEIVGFTWPGGDQAYE